MKRALLLLFLIPGYMGLAFAQKLPIWNEAVQESGGGDWLIKPEAKKAGIYRAQDGKSIVIYNGLLRRSFRLVPNVACYDFVNLQNGKQLIRSVKAEARVTINGKNYNVGGLYGQKENAYLLPEWLDNFTTNDNDFGFAKYEVNDIVPVVKWKSGSWWAGNTKQPSGKTVTFFYGSNLKELAGIEIAVHYSIYDGLPLVSKWITIENKSTQTVKLNQAVNEIIGFVEEESAVTGAVNPVTNAEKSESNVAKGMLPPQGIYIESNYAFNNAMRYNLSDQTTHWKADSTYRSQVNYEFGTPCLLEIYPNQETGTELLPNASFHSVTTYELLLDSYDRERRGLMVRKMYRTIAPWVTANPIYMHLVSKNDDQVRAAIDQCAATGYEALILSFGSHIDQEDVSETNLLKWKQLADYAHQKNIKIGGYSLFSSRKIGDADDVINRKTGKPGGAFFGSAPCYGSQWGLAYRDKIKKFYTETGFDIWENDGPYAGDVCASVTHPGHKNLEDSQWKQMEIQKELYHWLNERGVYINAPDWYFLDGTNKIGIGYREVNFSLSREQQVILNRQNIYDGLWNETPAMVWGFVPLTKYQGGGPEAVLEPLSEHLADYKKLMIQYYGAGVQAAYRGPRLYDTEATKQTVTAVIKWYKKYREILNSDIIHLRRADGMDWDGIMHVNPQLKEKGLLMLYNPLKQKIARTIKVPLYYTGLSQSATFLINGEVKLFKKINRDFRADLTFNIDPESYIWVLVE
ncbi:MAG: hypothetical protein JWQ57_862 [Mucilaginibacter sp.]|nr:hypothetical protein [Mucilaginibacter sp.]